MTKRWFHISCLAFVLTAVSIRPAGAQEDGYPFRLANFSLEFVGGYSKLNPHDFNTYAEYEEAYVQHYYVKKFEYYHGLYGDAYQVAIRRTGDQKFNPLSAGKPFGARLRYDLSPSLGLSIGIQHLTGTQNSQVELLADIQSSSSTAPDPPGSSTYQYLNSDFILEVSAWLPQLAAHFGWDIGRILRAEILVAGGPMFVACRAYSERQAIFSNPAGYRSESVTAVEMKGEAKGFSGELGGRIRIRTLKFLDIFAEGSYAFREATEIRGPGWSKTIVMDSNGGQTPIEAKWDGQWNQYIHNSNTNWGSFVADEAQNRYQAGPGLPMAIFSLNLSGFQAKAGLALKF